MHDTTLGGHSESARYPGSCADAPLLRVRDLVTMFPTASSVVVATNRVSLDLARGETLGIVGESGSGKSVTCRSFLRMVPAPGRIVAGSVVFEGRDVLGMARREMRSVRGGDIAMIFQDPMASLNPVYTVGNQIGEALRTHGRLSRRDARDRSVELLERVGVAAARTRLRAYPHELSGGMRQRVMIAIAISCRPKLLLADEPTTAVDVTIQDQILSLLLELQAEEGMSIILISHDLGVVAETCGRVAVMYAGFVVEQGPTAELFRAPQHPYTRALLAALPEIALARGDRRVTPIAGQPPDLASLPAGCPFAPRCEHVRPGCTDVSMELRRVAGTLADHLTACPYSGRGWA